MSDANAAGGQQPTEEEVRAYLAQLRQTDVAEIVAQSFSMLASGAEVKLGRRDARLLIDTAAALAERARGSLDDRLVEQMDEAVGQLRTAQVDAEAQLKQLRDEGKLPEGEAGDLPGEGAGAAGAAGSEGAPRETPPPPPPQQPQRGSGASRLWIPGR